MPVTRSTGRGRATASTEPTTTDEATPTATTTTRTSTTTGTTQDTGATQEQLTSSAQGTPDSRPPAPPPSKSIRTTSSRRALRLAKAREEALRVKLELAQARVAAIEAEDSDDEEATVLSTYEQRVDDWFDANQRLAIADVPHNPEQEPQQHTTPEGRERTVIENNPVIAATGFAAPLPPPPPPPPPSPPPLARALGTGPVPPLHAGEKALATHTRSVEISELAAAIAAAARGGHRDLRHHIELPIFNGAYQEWLSFRAAFNESAPSYNEADNVARLRKSLKGKAKEAVDNLLIFNARSSEIMRTLESRFGRPDTIALAELERLRAMPRLSDAPRDICSFACRVANAMATLRALGRSHYLHSPETTRSMLDKLPPTLKYRWFDYAASVAHTDEPDLLKLSTFLQREADYCAPYAQPENIETAGATQPPKRTHRAFATTTKPQKPTAKCACCNADSHNVAACPKFLQEETNERWKLARSLRLCFRCLRHRNKTHFCKRVKCERDGCEYSHHKLLHGEKEDKKIDEAANETVASTWMTKHARAYLKIVPVEISGPAGVAHTHALLDDGSTITLIDEQLARQVGINGPKENLKIEAIADTKIATANSRRVKLGVRGTGERFEIHARTIQELHISPQSVNNEDVSKCEHLQDIQQHLRYQSARPRVLIGQDNWHLLIASEVRRGRRHQPVASLTPLGWALHGAHTRTLGRQTHSTYHVCVQNDDEDMNQQLSKYFALENLLVEAKRPQSDPEERALAALEGNIVKRSDGHYEAPLLWTSEDAKLPDNYDNALRRLVGVEKKLDNNPVLKQRYNQEMNALLTKGYAEPAPPHRAPRVWYLPHFAVLNPAKPDKVRIVHDAAAKTRGVSLNDRLLTGPDLLQPLPGVLMRFRQHPVAVAADIREMFMQVKIKPEDRDTLRYLWRGDRRDDAPPDEYRMTSLVFGATCSPSIAIFVKNKNAEQYQTTHPEAAEAIVKNHYVDDYLKSFENVADAIRISRDVRHIHNQAHYELRQWASNSEEVIENIAEKPARHATVDLNNATERVLGQTWKPSTDEIAFNLDLTRLPPDALDNAEPTKREVLKTMMSVFDPLGLATPVTVIPKKILQEVWRRGTGWDEKLDADLAQRWAEWTRNLKALREVTIPRCYPGYTRAIRRELHVFVDASETAYTCALYWRATTTDGAVRVTLVAAKAKVAPLKLTSIPRLELQAAVLGAKMAAAVVEEHDHKPDSKTFWTDSRTVLAWLRTGARSYRPFVAHRIAAIEEHTAINEWRWVPTKQNVADEATREAPQDFDSRHRWFTGPDFLYDDYSTWPTESPQQRSADITATGEERVHIVIDAERTPYSWLPLAERFSRWEKMLRAIARALQFTDLCRPHRARSHYKRTAPNKRNDADWTARPRRDAPTTTKKSERKQDSYVPLDAKYLLEAEKLVVRAVQHESFYEEIRNLKKNQAPSLQSRLRPLSVELVNGVIVIKTRINAASDITEAQRRPPVLDANHPAVKLYIDFVHRQLAHSGVESTINECKQHYAILRLRPVARMTLHRCLPCRIRRQAPPVPPTGDHPRSRLAHHKRPFTYTGLDYFGPLTVTVGRSTHKRYVALFTCLTVRAIHLEVVPNLSGDSAVMALRRMIARRGCPTELWSDNGTNFHAADRELREAFQQATREEATQRQITWRFIPAGAPFMGGAWERLVATTKTALRAVLQERRPSDETLATLLAEAEYTVNSRPLTHVAVDPDEPEAITPNHFLLGGSARVPTPGAFDDSELIGRATWKTSQRLADHFWSRWLREYLPTLQYRREPHGRGAPIAVDDIVLVVDGTLPRNTWPRGRVIATYPGPDGVTRAVDVQTKGGVLRRPTKKLVILPTQPDVLHDGLSATLARAIARREHVPDDSVSKCTRTE
ncbi:uncharacterized protein [Choristoneura fumiferana]|uniref:uncharacterized protein n=1 Tax=Choristoneura fumiferana TaxID=7141 RepID=UPI003D15E6FA